jgi:hypothetical protein
MGMRSNQPVRKGLLFTLGEPGPRDVCKGRSGPTTAIAASPAIPPVPFGSSS